MAPSPEIVVFYWPGSPWASKVTSYLTLRGVPFTECHQSITMPRPTLEALGVNYRRIPIVAIGRDIYCDTLLILEKLETYDLPGKGKLGGKNGEQKAIEKLLEKWTDLGVFPQAADCIPLDHPLVQDPKFIQDRTDLWGWSWERDNRVKRRPQGLANMRIMFDFLENTLLSDGREWVLGTKEPTLADIHSAWIFDWMLQLEGSFPEELISKQSHPKTFAWCDRYNKAVEAAKNSNPENEVVDGEEARKRVSAGQFFDPAQGVNSNDPLELKEGQEVLLSPLDTGFSAKDKGKLFALNAEQVVIGTKTKDGVEVRIHNPRWNFSVKAA